MKLVYINTRDTRCFSRRDGLNLAYLTPALILYGLPVLAVTAFLMF